MDLHARIVSRPAASENPDPMPTRRSLALLPLALLLIPFALASCGSKEKEKAKEKLVEQPLQLANGLKGSLIPGPCGDGAALSVVIAAGSDHDPAGRSGMARVVATLLGAWVGRDHMSVSLAGTSDQIMAKLDELAGKMARFQVTDDDLGRARTQVLEQLAKMRGGERARVPLAGG
jgi:hypothetical protein